MSKFAAPIIFLSLALSTHSHAATLYSDEATFQAATGAVAEAPIPNTGVQPGDTGTVGNLTFAVDGLITTELYFGDGGAGPGWSTLIPGNDIALSGPESMLIAAGTDLTAIGFYLHEPTVAGPGLTDTCNAACSPSLFDFTFLLDGALVDVVAGYDPDDGLNYLGMDVGSAFDTVLVQELGGTIDNEFFGAFSTATAPASVIPLPAGLPLLMGGLALLGMIRRRS